MSVPKWLLDLGIPEACITRRSSASDKQRSFSIELDNGEEMWRIHYDGGWQQDNTQKKVDYLFWGKSKSGDRVILLVELKGRHYEVALEQIEQTLEHLCKHAKNNIVHQGRHRSSPGHSSSGKSGIRAYVVLSKSSQIPSAQNKAERIRQKYGVRVCPRTTQLKVQGIR